MAVNTQQHHVVRPVALELGRHVFAVAGGQHAVAQVVGGAAARHAAVGLGLCVELVGACNRHEHSRRIKSKRSSIRLRIGLLGACSSRQRQLQSSTQCGYMDHGRVGNDEMALGCVGFSSVPVAADGNSHVSGPFTQGCALGSLMVAEGGYGTHMASTSKDRVAT